MRLHRQNHEEYIKHDNVSRVNIKKTNGCVPSKTKNKKAIQTYFNAQKNTGKAYPQSLPCSSMCFRCLQKNSRLLNDGILD